MRLGTKVGAFILSLAIAAGFACNGNDAVVAAGAPTTTRWPSRLMTMAGDEFTLRNGIGRALGALACAVLVVVAFACGPLEDEVPVGAPAAARTPTPTGSQPLSPASKPEITREQAVEIAHKSFGQDNSLTTAVEDPHDMVTRLMRLRELHGAESLPIYATYRDALVWIAQVEGTSQTAKGTADVGGVASTYRFNAVAIDAVTGDVIAHLPSEYEPFILPLEFLPDEIVNAETEEHTVERDSLTITRDEAVQTALDEYSNSRRNKLDAIETVLVRYSNPLVPGENAIGPPATPTKVPFPTPTPTAGPPRSPTVGRTPQPTSTPVVDRLSWVVIVPSHLSFGGCFISGGMSESHLTCWMQVLYLFVDAETGSISGRGVGSFIGPGVSNNESLALQHFAWAEGWWALWHEVKQYNGDRLPAGLAARLDRPDAPTPTPYPPTPTPPAGSTPTPTPTPAPTRVPDSTETFGRVIAEGDIAEGHWRVGGFTRDGTFCAEFHLNGLGKPRCGYTRSHFLTRVPMRRFSDAAVLYGFSSREVAIVRVEPDNGQRIDVVPVDLGYEPDNFFAVQLGPPLDFSTVNILAIGGNGEELYRLESTLESSSVRQ